MQNNKNCAHTHIYSYEKKQYVTDFKCIMCGRMDVVSNNQAEQFKQNNFIVPKKTEA